MRIPQLKPGTRARVLSLGLLMVALSTTAQHTLLKDQTGDWNMAQALSGENHSANQLVGQVGGHEAGSCQRERHSESHSQNQGKS